MKQQEKFQKAAIKLFNNENLHVGEKDSIEACA
jgi:hypothetical protein